MAANLTDNPKTIHNSGESKADFKSNAENAEQNIDLLTLLLKGGLKGHDKAKHGDESDDDKSSSFGGDRDQDNKETYEVVLQKIDETTKKIQLLEEALKDGQIKANHVLAATPELFKQLLKNLAIPENSKLPISIDLKFSNNSPRPRLVSAKAELEKELARLRIAKQRFELNQDIAILQKATWAGPATFRLVHKDVKPSILKELKITNDQVIDRNNFYKLTDAQFAALKTLLAARQQELFDLNSGDSSAQPSHPKIMGPIGGHGPLGQLQQLQKQNAKLSEDNKQLQEELRALRKQRNPNKDNKLGLLVGVSNPPFNKENKKKEDTSEIERLQTLLDKSNEEFEERMKEQLKIFQEKDAQVKVLLKNLNDAKDDYDSLHKKHNEALDIHKQNETKTKEEILKLQNQAAQDKVIISTLKTENDQLKLVVNKDGNVDKKELAQQLEDMRATFTDIRLRYAKLEIALASKTTEFNDADNFAKALETKLKRAQQIAKTAEADRKTAEDARNEMQQRLNGRERELKEMQQALADRTTEIANLHRLVRVLKTDSQILKGDNKRLFEENAQHVNGTTKLLDENCQKDEQIANLKRQLAQLRANQAAQQQPAAQQQQAQPAQPAVQPAPVLLQQQAQQQQQQILNLQAQNVALQAQAAAANAARQQAQQNRPRLTPTGHPNSG